MSQRITGLYRLTQIPGLYSLFQNLLGADHARRELIATHVQPQPGERVLDFGCGPGTIRPYLGNVSYTGIDLNSEHIATAKGHFPDATFHAGSLDMLEREVIGQFDLVICVGVLHHLDDDQVVELCRLIEERLSPGGRFVTMDPTFAEGQHWFARWMASKDSGQSVRSPDNYCKLVSRHLPKVTVTIRNNLLRIPYSHCILVATRPNGSSRTPLCH